LYPFFNFYFITNVLRFATYYVALIVLL